MRYLDQATIDDAKNARGCGITLDRIAGHLGITVAELRHALELPPLQHQPVAAAADEALDLWSIDRLDSIL